MIAIVFPGQGSQARGMLSAYDGIAAVGEAVQEVSEAITVDLATLIENDEAALNNTVNTQPAMLALGVGVYRAAAAVLPPPLFFAGHSLGEYSALVCAEALSLAAAARLVVRRATLMQQVSGGGMAAILGASAALVEEQCAALRADGESVWAANYNAEGQIVIAGLKTSIEKAGVALKSAGAKRVVILPMSVPSHCPLLQPAADAFLADLDAVDWRPADSWVAPVLHTASVPTDSAADGGEKSILCRTMAAQLLQPVHWTKILQDMAAAGVESVYESGPGKVLSNLGKKSTLPHISLDNAVALTTLARP